MSNYPRMTYNGILQNTTRQLVSKETITPSTATPLFLILSDQGDFKETLIQGQGQFVAKYGNRCLDKNGPFYNHQTYALQEILERNGSMVVKRIELGGETFSTGALYANNIDNAFVAIGEYDLTAINSISIVSIEALEPGSGINYEIIFNDPDIQNGLTPEQLEFFTQDHAFPANVQVYKKQRNSRVLVDEFLVGFGSTVPEFDLEHRLSPKYGLPFKVTVNYSQAQNLIYNIVLDNDPLINSLDIDVLFGSDLYANIPSWSILNDTYTVMVKDGQDGLPTTITGGVDKLQTLASYDLAVANYMVSIADGRLSNRLKYSFRSFFDTGFSLSTKKLLKNLKVNRPELVLVIGDYSVADYVEIDDPNPPSNEISCVDALVYSSSMIMFCDGEMYSGVTDDVLLGTGSLLDIGNAIADGRYTIDFPPFINNNAGVIDVTLDLLPDDAMRSYAIWFNGSLVFDGILTGVNIDPLMIAQYQIFELEGVLTIRHPIEDNHYPFSLFIVPMFDVAENEVILPETTVGSTLVRYSNGTIGLFHGFNSAFPFTPAPNPQAYMLVVSNFTDPQGATASSLPIEPFGIFLTLGAVTASGTPSFIVQPSDTLLDVAGYINNWAMVNGYNGEVYADVLLADNGPVLRVFNRSPSGIPLTFCTLNAYFQFNSYSSFGNVPSLSLVTEQIIDVIDTIDWGIDTPFKSCYMVPYIGSNGLHVTFINGLNQNSRRRIVPVPQLPLASYQKIDWTVNGNPTHGYNENGDSIFCLAPYPPV